MLFRLLREIGRPDEKTCADQTKKKRAPCAPVTKRQHEQFLTREEPSANFLGATGLDHRTRRMPDFRALPEKCRRIRLPGPRAPAKARGRRPAKHSPRRHLGVAGNG